MSGYLGAATWAQPFSVACYAAFLLCFFHAIEAAARRESRPALLNLAQLLAFVVAYWFVESWAHRRAGYYIYSGAFGDLLPRIPLSSLGIPAGAHNECSTLVARFIETEGLGRIPLSVIAMEASLTYASLRTARVLCSGLLAQAALTALMVMNVDILLDPVIASSQPCQQISTSLTAASGGAGLWRWYISPDLSVLWFGIPIFNYAAWFAAPALLALLTGLSRRPLSASMRREQLAVVATVPALVAFVALLVPGRISTRAQLLVFLLAMLIATYIVLRGFRRTWQDGQVRGLLAMPSILIHSVALAPLLLTDLALRMPAIVPVAVVSTVAGAVLALAPHRSMLTRLFRVIGDCDRFLRVHYFGYTFMLVLLGAAGLGPSPSYGMVVGLVVVALGFHVYAYVLNDVLDLEVDRTQPRRQRDPMVRGAISREAGLGIAVVQVPICALVTFRLGGAFQAWLALSAAFILLLVYNRWGKVCPVPPITDFLEGLGWGALALFGMWIAKPDVTWQVALDATGPIFLFGVGFITLINGVHGGLRDLWSDAAMHKRTTAIFLGARARAAGSREQEVESSGGLAAFAFVVHTAMFIPMLQYLVRDPIGNAEWSGVSSATLCLIFFVSSYMLWRVVRRIEPARTKWLSAHLFVLLLAPLVFYAGASQASPILWILAACALLFPLAAEERIARAAVQVVGRVWKRA